MRKSFFASIRCALKTTNEPLDVIYNALVGCYISLCNNDLKGEPLDNEGYIYIYIYSTCMYSRLSKGHDVYM